MGDSVEKRFTTGNLKLAALCAALDGTTLVAITPDPLTGRLSFAFDGVPPSIERDILNDTLKVSARDMLRALEDVHQLVIRHRAIGEASHARGRR